MKLCGGESEDIFEQRIAALHGGIAALSVSSGAAAITYAIENVALSGDHIVAAKNIYGGTYNLFAVTMKRMGIEFTFISPDSTEFISDDNLFNYQAKIIRDLAESQNCIIIGRCGDYVLRNDPKAIRIFVCADEDACVNKVVELYGLDADDAKKKIDETEKGENTAPQTPATPTLTKSQAIEKSITDACSRFTGSYRTKNTAKSRLRNLFSCGTLFSLILDVTR